MIRKKLSLLAIAAVFSHRLHNDTEIHAARGADSRRLAKWSGIQRDPGHAGSPGCCRPAMAGILRR